VFARTRYLTWARRYYGRVRFDLASSGASPVPLAALGVPAPEVLDDLAGWDALQAAIARYNNVPTTEAIAALGTTHALWLAYASLTSAGDEVLVESPGYEPVSRIPEGMGLSVRVFERPAAERFALDPARVERAMTAATRVVAVTHLHNPSGVRANDEALRAVATAAASRGASLLVDEVYAPFDALVDATGVFRGSARKLAPNIVAVGSLTKAYGLGNHRFGWVLGSPELIERAADAITASAGMLPLSHAHLGVRAFARIGELADRTRSSLAGKRARVGEWVAAHGLTWSEPAEGLFGFVRVPGACDLLPTLEAAAIEHEVLVAPGSFFGVNDGFRVSWSAPRERLDEGLERLGRVLAGLPR
jgi:aspartate/methionine/tyrosine aminotransferase